MKGVWDSPWSKVFYPVWSVQKYTWGNTCLVPDLAVVFSVDICYCLAFVLSQSVQSVSTALVRAEMVYLPLPLEGKDLLSLTQIISTLKMWFEKETLIQKTFWSSIFPKAFWTDIHKKKVSKSGVTYSPSKRVKLLHSSWEKGDVFQVSPVRWWLPFTIADCCDHPRLPAKKRCKIFVN